MNYCSIVCSDVWWIQNFSELYLHIFTSILRLHMNLLIQINKCDIVWQSKILLKFQGVALRCYVKLLVRLIQVSVSWILQFWWSNRHDSHQKTSSKKAMLATFTGIDIFWSLIRSSLLIPHGQVSKFPRPGKFRAWSLVCACPTAPSPLARSAGKTRTVAKKAGRCGAGGVIPSLQTR